VNRHQTLRNINPTHNPHCPQNPCNHSRPSLPGLPFYLLGVILESTHEYGRKRHEEPEDKNVHFLHTRLILNLMMLLVNRWSLLTHASHCMTISSHAAGTQTRARVSPPMQPKIVLHQMPFCHATTVPSFRLGDWLTLR